MKLKAIAEQIRATDDLVEVSRLAERVSDAIAARMSPPGGLGLPPLLDERRMKYGIPDEAFEADALFDRVLVWQIQPKHEEGKDTFGDTMIIKPETQEKRILKESSRGVVVSAGLKALDVLRSNGVDLGHIIDFVRMTPWHVCIGNYNGIDQHLLVLRDGDFVKSEDVCRLRKEGKLRVQVVEGTHVYTDEDGHTRGTPQSPWVDQSY